ncbi:MAG: glycosyltransferase [Candidatus Helarchaeota archaeon]
MQKIKVLMLSHTPLPDSRVEKEARFLKTQGHEIRIICPYIKKRKVFDCFIEIISFGSIKNLLIRTLLPNIFQNKFLLFDLIKKFRPQVLHVHDIVMAIPALLISKVHGIPLVYDSHEAWDLYALSNFKTASFRSKLNHLLRYFIFLPFQRFIPKFSNFFIVTHDLMARFYLKAMRINPDKVKVLRNVVDFTEMEGRHGFETLDLTNKKLMEDLNNKEIFKVIYHGGLAGRKRPIRLLIKAMQYLKNERIILVIAGSKYDALKELAIELGVADSVHFTGFLTHDILFTILEKCDAGIICMDPKYLDGHVTSFVKLYEYFALGLPVLATPMYNLREVDDFITYWNSPKSLAEKIIECVKNKEKLLSISKEVKKYARQNNWQAECHSLKEAYELLSSK